MTSVTTVLPSADQLRDMASHVDHEMERLLRIGELRRGWKWLLECLPDAIRRALRVAYAAHSRALLEFFHDGRPRSEIVGPRKPHNGDLDVCLGDYTGKFGAHPWLANAGHEARLLDADKLLGHLTTGRISRGGRDEWGDLVDRLWMREVIEQIMAEVPPSATIFPRTHRALQQTRN